MTDTSTLRKSLGTYLKNISNKYKNTDKSSLSDILSSFSQMSKEYSEFTNNTNDEHIYSNVEYSKCSIEEQENFKNEILQFIECLVLNSVYDMSGNIYNWASIYKLMTDERYKNVTKDKRKLIYSCTKNSRPIGESSYSSWNGFQIIDLDIKSETISNELKPLLFKELCKYNWFLGVYKSASGKGLHVWTKIAPISLEQQNKKTEYLCNFRHKYSYVYIVLLKYASKLNYTKEDILRYMDMAMAKPQQGSFIAYDATAMMSTNFRNLRLDVNFESSLNNGIETVDWISHPDLKEIFRKLDWFANESYDTTSNVNITDIKNIEERDEKKSRGKKHYKHAQRWQLANTLVSIYGEEKALQIFMDISKDTPRYEIAADIKTASIHNKPISVWAIKELNDQHGFSLKIENNIYKKDIDKIFNEAQDDSRTPLDPTRVLNETSTSTILHITKDQYLSDVKDDILKNLSHITLLEAGAGYGKTEMIKAFKSKTLLILPFTSTIKAKVESSETTKDWLYFYGNKRPSMDDIFDDKSMTMTIDKFSRLNLMELNQADFDYIVVDESHLLFTSSYRDVMSPTIQRLANCKAKVIMMTGTPTGEMLFFPNITHIKVIKDDYRQKNFTVHFSQHKLEQFYNMCRSMRDDIVDGHKILFPTNKGNLFYETTRGFVQYLLNISTDEDGNPISHKLRSFYYKKSNYGDESMDSININKSINDNDMIFCSTYLSVGVDICDDYTFSVYFDDMWIPQDIEQFANRLRNNDLFIHMYLPQREDDDTLINYNYTKPLDLSFDESDLVFIQDLLKTLNDMLERNNEESKYSPIISSISSQYPFFKYDENECKYYIDETTYKLRVFEDRYKEYSKQLNVLMDGMRYYGYNINQEWNDKLLTPHGRDILEDFKRQCRNVKHNENTANTFDLINHITDDNIDIYKEFLKGSYDIFRAPEFKEDRIEHNLYVKDIEIINKNVPIILNLYKFYDIETIKDIFTYCVNVKSNAINYSQLDKIQRFIKIEANRKKKRLDFPVQKFIKEATDFAVANPTTTTVDIKQWIANYAAAYANSIPDVVVDDMKYFEHIYELMEKLWKVIIVETRPINGKIKIRPFELIWKKKNEMENLYGDAVTKTFFEEILEKMEMDDSSSVDETFDEQETEMDLPHTSKKRLIDIKEEIPNIVHTGFEYDKYTQQDGSNDRFLRKQENTNRLMDNIFVNQHKEVFDDAIKDLDELILFND